MRRMHGLGLGAAGGGGEQPRAAERRGALHQVHGHAAHDQERPHEAQEVSVTPRLLGAAPSDVPAWLPGVRPACAAGRPRHGAWAADWSGACTIRSCPGCGHFGNCCHLRYLHATAHSNLCTVNATRALTRDTGHSVGDLITASMNSVSREQVPARGPLANAATRSRRLASPGFGSSRTAARRGD